MRTRSILLTAILFLTVSAGFLACRNHSKGSSALINRWALKTLADTTFSVPGGYLYLQIDSKGTASGFGGCNDFSGTYTVNNTQLTFSNLSSTLLWCDLGDLETKFMNALQQTNNYSVSNGTLSLYHGAALLATLSITP